MKDGLCPHAVEGACAACRHIDIVARLDMFEKMRESCDFLEFSTATQHECGNTKYDNECNLAECPLLKGTE